MSYIHDFQDVLTVTISFFVILVVFKFLEISQIDIIDYVFEFRHDKWFDVTW